MIEDVIIKELKNNQEYMSLKAKVDDMKKKIDDLNKEKVEVLKKDKNLERVGLISQIVILMCSLANMNAILSLIAVFWARLEAKDITAEDKEYYQKQIDTLSNNISKKSDVLLDIFYETCDLVEKNLSPIKEEVIYHLKNKNYGQIIDNYSRYEDVILLIENDAYANLLLILTEYGRRGIPFSELSKEEKAFIDLICYNANEMDKFIDKKSETFGQKLRKSNDKYLDQNIKILKMKR